MTRPVPYSAEIEAACIAAMMTSDADAKLALDTLGPDDFHVPSHRSVFMAVRTLHEAGAPIEVLMVAEASGVTASAIADLVADSPVVSTAQQYIDRLVDLGAFRRTLTYAESLRTAADEQDAESIDRLLTDPFARIMPHYEPVTDPIEASVLALEDTRPDMLIAELQARLEVSMWVGEPGFGKSTLLRQIAVCAASGIHPFTGNPANLRRVLIVDCQESRAQAGREIARLLAIAGQAYRGTLWIEAVPQGIDLSSRRWQRWLDAKVARVDADLVILGPLYNMVRGTVGRSKQSEETAELAMNALGDLMVARNVGLMIEAHAPHGMEMRVRGSKLWEDWPDFGFGLVSTSGGASERAVNVERFRGDRHTGRRWPNRYEQGEPGDWPWRGLR